jgi:hypothetical protein
MAKKGRAPYVKVYNLHVKALDKDYLELTFRVPGKDVNRALPYIKRFVKEWKKEGSRAKA